MFAHSGLVFNFFTARALCHTPLHSVAFCSNLQFNVQFLVQGKGRPEDMKPYIQYMTFLLRKIYDAVSDDDRFELSYNDYLQVRLACAPN